MAALASDWLGHFCLLLWNRWTELNETWQEARSQRLLPSLRFSGQWVNKNFCPGWSVKKLAHCTQVHDMWPFGPLVICIIYSILSMALRHYWFNDHIDSIGNLTSPGCQSVNVLNLFDRTSRRHRSHGSRRYNKPEIHNVSFDGLHHIRTRLYSLPLKTLHVLYESTLTLHFTDFGSPEHRLQGIILDISSNRLFKAVRICDSIETKNRPFLKIKFANKGIDALNLQAIYRYWIKNPSKVIFLHILNIRSRHAFLTAILVRLLPNFSTTKQVCSKSTSKVFLRILYLVPALALSFFMLHVAI